MAKKNPIAMRKRQQTQTRWPRQPSIDLPEILTIDQLGQLSDEELITQLRSMRSALDIVRKERCSAKEWQTELCYIERELILRRTRREAHQEYLASIGEVHSNEIQEKNLPSADLDNTSFTALTAK